MAKRRVHRVPHEEVRAVLVARGIDSVNRAIEWGRLAGAKYPLISPKSIEGIFRGKRVLGVEFERVDQILCALDAPDVWYSELAAWYYAPGTRPEADFETFLPQTAAFERACEMMRGENVGLAFG